MSRLLRFGVLACLLSAVLGSATSAQEQQTREPAQLWADFNHYVLVARPDLAADAGEALLDAVEQPRLLEIVEASDYVDRYRDVLKRARQNEATKSVAQQLAQRIEDARIADARNPERIADNIQRLDDGSRPYRNAVRRLEAAGQFAAPQMLEALRDRQQRELHPFVVNAMVAIGKPLLAPLTQALPEVDPVVQTQLAQVFARIGHPHPGPMLKLLAEREDADETVRKHARRAYRQLRETSDLPADTPAARLYLTRGKSQYDKASARNTRDLLGFDNAKGNGVVWAFGPQAGLIEIRVPTAIFGDVLAMRSAKKALSLEPSLKPALSLWLTANLRRENRLPQGESDPTYGDDMRAPAFYARVAGPERLHDVLTRALNDTDSTLALDAIDVLSRTAGTDALVRRGASRQPLVRALSYPDQRIRFRAAQALAQARPREGFPAAERVVPVLVEPARAEQTRYAAVLANTQSRRNTLLDALSDLGYEAFAGATLGDIQSRVANRGGVDLIVVDKTIASVNELARQTRQTPMLAGAPLLALADPADQGRLSEMFADEPRVQTAVGGDQAAVSSAIERAAAAYQGTQLSERQRETFAVEGLSLLRQLAIASPVYEVRDVEPALIRAIQDDRNAVATGAARVLEVLDSQDAQRALMNRALREDRESVKIALLESLAKSAIAFGNRINESQQARLNTLVRQAGGELAVAAAEAHGALQLPAQQAVKLIVSPGGEQ